MQVKIGGRYKLLPKPNSEYNLVAVWQSGPKTLAMKDKVLCYLYLLNHPTIVFLGKGDLIFGLPCGNQHPDSWCRILTDTGVVGWAFLSHAEWEEIKMSSGPTNKPKQTKK